MISGLSFEDLDYHRICFFCTWFSRYVQERILVFPSFFKVKIELLCEDFVDFNTWGIYNKIRNFHKNLRNRFRNFANCGKIIAIYVRFCLSIEIRDRQKK